MTKQNFLSSNLSIKLNLPYVISYCFALIALGNACFFEKKYLVYTLPPFIIAIGFVYVKEAKKINVFFLIGLLAIIMGDLFTYSDAFRYFPYICISFAIYFLTNTLALKDYFSFKKFEIRIFFSLPLLISAVLLIYLIYSITILILPNLEDYLVYIFVMVYFLLFNLAISYYIYVKDLYKKGLSLLVLACVYIFLIAAVSINELIYSSRVFTILANLVHIIGFYILLYFFSDPKPFDKKKIKEKYL